MDRPGGLYQPNGLYQVSRDPLWGAVNRPRQHTFQSMSRSLDQLDGLDSFGDLTGLASHDPDPLGAPSLELAKLHAHDLLPHDPYNPERLFPLNAHVVAFEAFGVGIYTYMKTVRRMGRFFGMLFLMAMSNMVTNFYGNALDQAALDQMSYPMWFFTVTSIGNSGALAQANGGCWRPDHHDRISHRWSNLVCTARPDLVALFRSLREPAAKG